MRRVCGTSELTCKDSIQIPCRSADKNSNDHFWHAVDTQVCVQYLFWEQFGRRRRLSHLNDLCEQITSTGQKRLGESTDDQSVEHNVQDDAVMTLRCFIHMLEKGAELTEIDSDESPAVQLFSLDVYVFLPFPITSGSHGSQTMALCRTSSGNDRWSFFRLHRELHDT